MDCVSSYLFKPNAKKGCDLVPLLYFSSEAAQHHLISQRISLQRWQHRARKETKHFVSPHLIGPELKSQKKGGCADGSIFTADKLLDLFKLESS